MIGVRVDRRSAAESATESRSTLSLLLLKVLQRLLRIRAALVGGLAIPLDRLVAALVDAATVLVAAGEVLHRLHVALVGRQPIVADGLLQILIHALAGFVGPADIVQRRRMALVRGLAIE